MSTAKATNYLHLLDAARCNAEWDAVPEWCRKVRKHAPQRKCIALTAETEARLRHLPPPPASSSQSTKESYLATLNGLQDPLHAELRSPDTLKKLPSPAGGGESMVTTPRDILQARIVVAWIYILKQEWNEALEVVPGEEEVGEGWDGGGGSSAYMDIMRIKALVIKGIALSNTTYDQSVALQVFRAATRLCNTLPAEQRSSAMYLIWTEKAMSHYAQAAYRCWLEARASHGRLQGNDGQQEGIADTVEDDSVGVAIGRTIVDEGTVASAFRRFSNFISAQQQDGETLHRPADRPLGLDMQIERREIYRSYFKFLSLLSLPAGHPDYPVQRQLGSSATRPGNDDNAVSLVISSDVNGGTSDGKAYSKEQLRGELKEVAKVYEDYLMKTLSFPKAEEYHEIVGEWVDQVVENWRVAGCSGDDATIVVQTLYKAATRTFHSPRILRHLFNALTAIGNFQDAIAALSTYLELVEKAKERISKGNVEKDFDPDGVIFQTAVEGIRVVCKFADDGEKAMKVASQLEKWVDEWRITDKDILSDVYRGIGIANAHWSRRTAEAKDRQGAQKSAADAFKKGLSYDQSDVQAWFGLAFVEAEMGSVEDATDSVRKGLGALQYYLEDPDDVNGSRKSYIRNAVPLLHLLALLMTAKSDFDGAEKVCINAFELIGEGREAVSDLGVADKVALLDLKMTHIAVLEPVDGPEAAIPMTDELLSLYGTLFDGTHLVQPPTAEENMAASPSNSTRPTTASRRSRLVSIGRKRQDSASASSVLPGESSEKTARSGTIKKRPKSGHQSLGHSSVTDFLHDAPKIQVTDASGGASPVEKAHRRLSRPSSVSGGTIRRMRSLSSMKSSATSVGAESQDESPTPPMPSSTEASYYGSPAASVKGRSSNDVADSPSGSAASTTAEIDQTDGAVDSVPVRQESPRAKDIAHNLPRDKLPYPLRALGRTISDDGETGRRRTIQRPAQLPEPKLGVEEERKLVLGALRKAWLCVAGLYRRAGYLEDSAMAVEEAMGLVGKDGEGESDVLAERAFLQLAHGHATIAANLFEAAIAVDYDHPHSIIGLSALLLDMPPDFLTPLPPAESTRPPSSRASSPDSAAATTTPTTPTPTTPGSADGSDEEATLEKVIARNRALGLLEKLVVTARGWNIAEAWFLLADALTKAGETEMAKEALWRVVELEDSTGVRRWSGLEMSVL